MSDIIENEFYHTIKNILEGARRKVYATANSAMVQAYWHIGQAIVEEQSKGTRAENGSFLRALSKRLTQDFGKGFTTANLRNMRQFYLTFPDRQALSPHLSWSHYRLLMRVQDGRARQYYLEECCAAGWSTRQLERQINSFCYERALASRDKNSVRREIESLEPGQTPEDTIRDPYVLEFLGLPQSDHLYEKDLESALLGQLQDFLLELGRGFSFVARQKRIDLDGESFYIDLVFYNYILKCFVLIDLKVGKLTHQDIGQMDTYVRIYDELQRGLDDNPTIGLILCSEKNEAIAKYSVLSDGGQIFASRYQLTLPTAEELEQYLEAERRRFDDRQDIL